MAIPRMHPSMASITICARAHRAGEIAPRETLPQVHHCYIYICASQILSAAPHISPVTFLESTDLSISLQAFSFSFCLLFFSFTQKSIYALRDYFQFSEASTAKLFPYSLIHNLSSLHTQTLLWQRDKGLFGWSDLWSLSFSLFHANNINFALSPWIFIDQISFLSIPFHIDWSHWFPFLKTMVEKGAILYYHCFFPLSCISHRNLFCFPLRPHKL
mgnify:CR=1 FL=1